ncbi:MAG TPA: SUKH-4 family immunity protein [Candidatus Saccharimonadales bacterium]|nr:SUKH-4 family immunity protein [Candidatus Saccharimonadales bacterium]
MITPQQFKQRWESVADDHLVVFPASSLSDVRVPLEVLGLLTEAGLPDQAAPFLDFGPPKSGTLERASVVWHQPSTFDRYRIVGGNGSGDPVCLDEEVGGQIVYLNHDNRFQRVLMASSIFTLAECLVEFRDVVAGAGGDTESVTPQQYAALLARFRGIDPAASGAGGYWEQEIGCFEPAGEKSWWQFWKKRV